MLPDARGSEKQTFPLGVWLSTAQWHLSVSGLLRDSGRQMCCRVLTVEVNDGHFAEAFCITQGFRRAWLE